MYVFPRKSYTKWSKTKDEEWMIQLSVGIATVCIILIILNRYIKLYIFIWNNTSWDSQKKMELFVHKIETNSSHNLEGFHARRHSFLRLKVKILDTILFSGPKFFWVWNKLKYLLIGPNKFLTYKNFYETLFLD